MKRIYTDPLLVWRVKSWDIHIICDARKTGVAEPWLFEVASRDNPGFRVDSPTVMYFRKATAIELTDTTGSIKVAYLGGMPLIELDSLIDTSPSIGVPYPNYTHYTFTINAQLLDKPIFKFTHKIDGGYGLVETEKKYVTILLSTNDTVLSRAVQRCNDQLADSILSKKFFAHIE